MVAKSYYLKAMGIDVYQRRVLLSTLNLQRDNTHAFSEGSLATPAITQTPITQMSLSELQACVANCALCTLQQTRTKTVFGVGSPNANLLIIGEAPGANEDLQGEPFVGRAGKLLDNMLLSIGFKREQIYIANILKCRPPNNRDPNPIETATCTPYLLRQIELIQPKVLLAVGKIAANYLLNTNTALTKLRGQWHQYGTQNLPLLITFHPAYLLRSPREKVKAFEDLVVLRKRLLEVE